MKKPLRDVISDWWNGEFVAPENDPSSGLVFVGHHQKHWTSKAAHFVINFWLSHWKWIIGTALALVALIMQMKRL